MVWVIVSFAVALVLDSVSLGATFQPYNPPWTILVLIYWCSVLPKEVGPFWGFVVGLLMDTLSAGVLGLQALGGALIGYLANRVRPLFNSAPLWQQAVMAWGLVVVYKAAVGWIESLFASSNLGAAYWISSVVVLAAWPLAYALLKELTPIKRRA